MEAAVPAATAAAGGGGPAASGATGSGVGKDNPAKPPAAAAPAAAATPEEEAIKRNTDCVYFLASPLTCKKGADCEYRHSEGARVNPRDCYYWLNGNCLNPKCSFRHPPLEGLFGTGITSSGTLLPPQAATAAQTASYTSRQIVPCYYFQRGLCLKGDRCSFSHGATPMPNPVSQQTPKLAAQVAEPQQTLKKPSWTIEKCHQNIPKDSAAVPVMASTLAKRGPAIGTGGSPANGLAVKNNVHLKTELPSRPETNNVPMSTGNVSNRLQSYQSRQEINSISVSTGNVPNRLQTYQSNLADEQLQNERDGDEFMHESSPGFDVLVDDENEEAGYYHNEDDYRDPSGNDGRSFKPLTEFDYSQNSEYENAARFSREGLREEGEYDDHVQLRDSYDRERRVSSSDRMLERASAPKRSRRGDTMSEVDGSDLRHRLKQRKLNGRSGFSPDQPSELYRRTDRYTEEQRYGSRRHRDDQHQAPGRISVSKRLQGRISLPGRMPTQTDANVSDKAADAGIDWVGRPSVGRPSSQQGRQRVRQRSSEEFPSGERTPVHIPRNEEVEKSVVFAGPKRPSDLRGAKPSGISDQRSSRDTKAMDQKDVRLRRALGNHQETESADFEGPKSLSDILKRKREAAGLGQRKEVTGPDNGDNGNSMAAADMILEENVNPLENTAGEEEEEGMITTDEQGLEAQYYDIADANENEYIEDQTGEYEQVDGEYEYGNIEEGQEYYYEDEEGAYQDEGAYQEEGLYQEEEIIEIERHDGSLHEKIEEPMPN